MVMGHANANICVKQGSREDQCGCKRSRHCRYQVMPFSAYAGTTKPRRGRCGARKKTELFIREKDATFGQPLC